ncbi:lipoxygenase family protein [Neolewinella litorea]|uniref:Lipoxygenase domain-containing protein n=1 Tax=Neolewinella litorea TaxID=2562452 RepID=A0A4V3XL29_9BACT|nr:lipoxygenase family protein [Neolewinella litorea]THH39243.1 hypothetical protein E4021_10820 [Neolewinella litorea]
MSGKPPSPRQDPYAKYGGYDNVQRIYRECIESTKPVPSGNRGVLKPKLKGFHHLDIAYSKMVTATPALILDWLYETYDRVRDQINQWAMDLFPRYPKIWGPKEKDSVIVGRTTYASREDLGTPLHHMRVEIWARTWWLSWRRLAKGFSDHDGNFRLKYDLRTARSVAVRKIRAEVSQKYYRYSKTGQLSPCYCIALAIPIPKSDLVGMQYNLRDIQIDIWSYRPDSPIPRVKIDDLQDEAPEKYVEGRDDAITDQFIPVELIKLRHVVQLRAHPDSLTIDQIQRDYPPNLTTCLEKRLPGYTRSDMFFGERMMNGMHALTFQPFANAQTKRKAEHYQDVDPDHLYHVVNWGYQGYDHNDIYAFPTTEMVFEIQPGDFVPRPLSITFTGALSAFDRDPYQERTFFPTDGKKWMQAKRVARCVGGLISEVDDHFARTHVNVEQYAIAAFRNLRLNPIASLLLPHLKEVSLVDHTADRLLISQEFGYLPRASALTEKGLHQRVRDTLGMLNWKDYEPMRVVNDHHHYAKAETLFWKITEQYIEEFMGENAAGIRMHWAEIYRMSQDLVTHSVPDFNHHHHLHGLEGHDKEVKARCMSYFEHRFEHKTHTHREHHDGECRALSPITRQANFADLDDQAKTEDWENLKELCCYAIHHATFLHSWVNEHQHDDIGEVLYCSLGIRFGEHPDGVLRPESDHKIALDPLRATQMLWWSNLLSRTEYGAITKNPDGDVNPRFGELLQEHAEEFERYGISVDNIESRTNI